MKKHFFIKKIIISFSAALIAVGIGIQSTIESYAYPEIYTCFPVFEQQNYSNLCWAACALMSGRKAYPSTTATQYDIVHYVKGYGTHTNYNYPASDDDEIISAANYVTNLTKSYYTPGHPMPPSFFVTQFNSGKVPMMQIRGIHHNDQSSSYFNIMHLVIPFRVVISGTGSNNDVIYYYDPKDGTQHYAYYSNLIAGTADYSNHEDNATMKYIKLFYY